MDFFIQLINDINNVKTKNHSDTNINIQVPSSTILESDVETNKPTNRLKFCKLLSVEE